MAFTVNSAFAGKAAGFYISAALQQANSLEYVTMIENIKFASNIQQMSLNADAAGGGVVTAAGCDFVNSGDLDLTEKILTPTNLQVNMQLCKSVLLDSWEALQMRAGAGAPPPASFDDYVISYLGEVIANNVESNIWAGTQNAAGEFIGFTGAGATGWLRAGSADPAVQVALTGGAGIAPTNATIIADMEAGLDAMPTGIIGKEDVYVYVNQRNYQLYIQAVSTLGYLNAYNMQGDYEPRINGYKIAVCNGLQDAAIVVARKSSLFFGTDLISDTTRIQMLDMANLDGSDNMRVVARYSAGTQSGVGADIVLVS